MQLKLQLLLLTDIAASDLPARTPATMGRQHEHRHRNHIEMPLRHRSTLMPATDNGGKEGQWTRGYWQGGGGPHRRVDGRRGRWAWVLVMMRAAQTAAKRLIDGVACWPTNAQRH